MMFILCNSALATLLQSLKTLWQTFLSSCQIPNRYEAARLHLHVSDLVNSPSSLTRLRMGKHILVTLLLAFISLH